MSLKDTVHTLKKYLDGMSRDLDKAVRGNKTAAQRVRTHSVHFAKIAKAYRKESVAAEKKENRLNRKKTARKRESV